MCKCQENSDNKSVYMTNRRFWLSMLTSRGPYRILFFRIESTEQTSFLPCRFTGKDIGSYEKDGRRDAEKELAHSPRSAGGTAVI